MKIFALYTNIILTKKPEWFDDFILKYNPWGLHVTLKQACFIEDEEIENLKEKVSQFFSQPRIQRKSIDITFDEVLTGTQAQHAIIVIARHADELIALQKDLYVALSEYKKYVDPMSKEYEENFKPHITISYGIPNIEYAQALELLKGGCHCEGVIQEIVLSTVKEITLEEAKNPANKTIYYVS